MRAVAAEARRSSAAMPRACSWSIAITSPPAFGCSRRTSVSRSWACAARPAATRLRATAPCAGAGPARAASSAVVERRRVDRCRPAPPTPSARSIRREVDGPDDAAVGERLAVAVLEVGNGLASRRRRRTGSRACPTGTACPTGRAGGAHSPNACRMAAPQARSSPAWWSSSKMTNASRGERAPSDRRHSWRPAGRVTIPCMSRGSPPSPGVHVGSRCSENAGRGPRPLDASGARSARPRRAGRRPPASW